MLCLTATVVIYQGYQDSGFQPGQPINEGIKYQLSDIIFMKSNHTSTGESTKLQSRFRGHLAMTHILTTVIYGIIILDNEDSQNIAALEENLVEGRDQQEDKRDEGDNEDNNSKIEVNEDKKKIQDPEKTTRVRRKLNYLSEFVA
ncbi:hypothetical protein HHI36_021794 [Cryptolaemus montrouzieri]|uniref:Uncharacterized protein n=1 Tax=Cryptolaemus montrouzieri TaxID=559131 RepID=A0ABD2MXS1_9CUCU